jgi:D-alanine-D-alanine ligase
MDKHTIKNKRIGVIAGGVSAERDVSLRSGAAVFKALRDAGHRVVFLDAKEDIYGALRREGVEIAFLALHGGWGEDGSIQGMFEVMEIPYTGSNVLASALAMDKVASKKIFIHHGLSIPPYIVCSDDSPPVLPFPSPWVVKPGHEGSSVGVSIVDSTPELLEAMSEARKFGMNVIIEQYIKGKEIQIGILGEIVLGGVEVRPKRRFYDYEAKYTPGLTEYIIPPELNEKGLVEAEGIAYSAHRALGCKGATRVDLLLSSQGNFYVLEVNTIPGLTETSLLPKIAHHAGYSFTSLIEEMLLKALEGRKC